MPAATLSAPDMYLGFAFRTFLFPRLLSQLSRLRLLFLLLSKSHVPRLVGLLDRALGMNGVA